MASTNERSFHAHVPSISSEHDIRPFYEDPTYIFGDHALVYCFQLRQSLFQHTLGLLLQYAGNFHLVEQKNMRLQINSL